MDEVAGSCSEAGCSGVVSMSGRCVVHLSFQDLQYWVDRQDVKIDATNVSFDPESLTRFIDVMPWRDGRRYVREGCFKNATFMGECHFDNVIFAGPTDFTGATFNGKSVFAGAVFQNDTMFNSAVFEKRPWFGVTNFKRQPVRFEGEVEFRDAEFHEGAWFADVHFGKWVSFAGANFGEVARFSTATFEGAAYYARATFAALNFAGVKVFRDLNLDEVKVAEWASFYNARFEAPQDWTSLDVGEQLVLDLAVFVEPLLLVATSPVLRCIGTQFRSSVTLRPVGSDVILDSARFAEPSRLQGNGINNGRLLSLRYADVGKLTISNSDLSVCSFTGAANLDQLHVEENGIFSATPRGSVRTILGYGLFRWTRRSTLAEEYAWRASVPQYAGWSDPRVQLPVSAGIVHPGKITDLARLPLVDDCPVANIEPLARVQPSDIAITYRSLRKGREDRKDEPGAADFYYGEMEMRRISGRSPIAERAILWAYWLTCGYSLRALRAVICLFVLLGLSTITLHTFGFVPGKASWADAFLYAAGAATRLISPPLGLISRWGETVLIAVSLVGPVLIGLAVLALRNRVKR
jgi:uncharacterized protein YjbI with pentapeptide repeats